MEAEEPVMSTTRSWMVLHYRVLLLFPVIAALAIWPGGGDAAAQGEDDEPTPEMKAALQETMLAVGELYDRMSIDVLFTEKGIEIRAEEVLKN